TLGKALEVGHIFKLGTRYSETMGARVLDESGKEVPIVMGSYGIGIERILAGAVELHHDGDGIRMPMSIAPLHVALLPLQMQDGAGRDAAERPHPALRAAGTAGHPSGAVEFHHDGDGIRMPMSIAPLHVALLPLQMQDGAVRDAAERLYRELTDAGIEVLLDDRDERAGVKFKDADLIGLP